MDNMLIQNGHQRTAATLLHWPLCNVRDSVSSQILSLVIVTITGVIDTITPVTGHAGGRHVLDLHNLQ